MDIYQQYVDSLKGHTPLVDYEKIIDYYTEADCEYEGWSEEFNMHFGYFKSGCNPLNLEQMLQQMNARVYQELSLSKNTSNHLLDMGCGLGATARQLAHKQNIDAITGVTVVAPQVLEAQRLAQPYLKECALTFALQDYHCTRFDDNVFDGAFAIESGCHSFEIDKKQLLAEAYRVIKPGSRFVMTDGFSIGNQPFNSVLDYCYKKVCNCWALGNFPELKVVKKTMQSIGFKNIKIEDASWRVAPSVAQIPFIAIRYFFKRLLKNNSQQKWNHLLAPLFLIPLALSKKRFGYFVISGEK